MDISFHLHLVVPNVPRVKIIPRYSSDSQTLQALFLEITEKQPVGSCMPLNTLKLHELLVSIAMIQYCEYLS